MLCDLKPPGPPNMLTDPSFVDLFWVDLSTNETSFWVQKRDADGPDRRARARTARGARPSP